ncbi:MAG: ABC transporter ATP-binding protein [Bacteroidota bacterium]
MKIRLEDVSKRYRREWILRHIELELQPAGRYAVTGPNGSGKSTLLKMLSGHLSPTKGKISFTQHEHPIEIMNVYTHLSFAAPYIELIEEFTLLEALRFHQRFRPFLADLSPEQIIEILDLKKATHAPIAQFSSGMKQRLKLVLACTTQADFILLDEPTTNLDAQGMAWYQDLLNTYLHDRLLIIASNVPDDYRLCQHYINILDYK